MSDIGNRSDEDIARVWLSYHTWVVDHPYRPNLSDAEEEQDDALREVHGWWALEAVWDLTQSHPERLWHIIVRMVELADDDRLLGNIAAGPLEELLCAHPYLFIDRVEAAARSSLRFRRCLSGVWGWYTIPDDVQERMRRTWQGEKPR